MHYITLQYIETVNLILRTTFSYGQYLSRNTKLMTVKLSYAKHVTKKPKALATVKCRCYAKKPNRKLITIEYPVSKSFMLGDPLF